jgi:hypothetical protein
MGRLYLRKVEKCCKDLPRIAVIEIDKSDDDVIIQIHLFGWD